MHWTLWTMLIAVVILVIEFFILRCFQVNDSSHDSYHDIELPMWVYILTGLLAFVPVFNLIIVIVLNFAVPAYIEGEYWDCRLKDPDEKGNENNIMLKIITFLIKEV